MKRDSPSYFRPSSQVYTPMPCITDLSLTWTCKFDGKAGKLQSWQRSKPIFASFAVQQNFSKIYELFQKVVRSTKISGDNHHTSAIIPPFCHDLTENRTETPAKKFFRPEVWPYLEADAFHCPLYTRPSTPTSTSQKSILVQVAT